MTDQQLAPVIRSWLKNRDVAPPDAARSSGQVMAQVPQTRQRGRWWPFPAFRRKAETATATDTTEYQPSPIPATNGHAPTVIGRTQTMLSPVKAITVSALVFVLGGVLFVAQPFDQQGDGVPGAATDASVSVVQGQYLYVGEGPTENLALDGMLERSRGTESGRLSMSDERLSGDVTLEHNIDRWATDEVEAIERAVGDVAIHWGTVLIENDGGKWEGTHFTADGQAPDRPFVSPVMQLTGTGDYEGLSAILYGTTGPLVDESPESVDGLIFPGELPPDR